MSESEEYIQVLKEQLSMTQKALDIAIKLKDSYRDLLHKCEGIEN